MGAGGMESLPGHVESRNAIDNQNKDQHEQHQLSPVTHALFSSSQVVAYHTAGHEESESDRNRVPLDLGADPLSKDQNYGTQVRQVHEFVREEFAVGFHSSHGNSAGEIGQ